MDTDYVGIRTLDRLAKVIIVVSAIGCLNSIVSMRNASGVSSSSNKPLKKWSKLDNTDGSALFLRTPLELVACKLEECCHSHRTWDSRRYFLKAYTSAAL